jgi:hypothetical protein
MGDGSAKNKGSHGRVGLEKKKTIRPACLITHPCPGGTTMEEQRAQDKPGMDDGGCCGWVEEKFGCEIEVGAKGLGVASSILMCGGYVGLGRRSVDR